MQDNTLYNKFQDLLKQDRQEGTYPVIPVAENAPHRIGCSLEGYPIFFIVTSDEVRTSDIKLELFHVMFNRECSIINVENSVGENHKFCIIQLNSNNTDFQQYFFGVMSLVMSRFKGLPTTERLKSEISKVIRLFTENPKLSLEVIRGLWAELLVIERAKDPEYLIFSWHVTPNEKYDFNDGVAKIEVKSASGSERKHTFSLEQLNPANNSDLLIASIFVSQTGLGKSVFDLVDSISGRITNDEALLKLREMTLSTIGPHIEEVSRLFFDYKRAIEEYAIFDHKDIPSIDKGCVPVGVEKVVFQSDLTGCTPIDLTSVKSDMTLFKSI